MMRSAVLSFVLAVAGMSESALAGEDGKTYPGTMCVAAPSDRQAVLETPIIAPSSQVGPDGENLVFNGGIVNISEFSTKVICPIVRDSIAVVHFNNGFNTFSISPSIEFARVVVERGPNGTTVPDQGKPLVECHLGWADSRTTVLYAARDNAGIPPKGEGLIAYLEWGKGDANVFYMSDEFVTLFFDCRMESGAILYSYYVVENEKED